MDFESFTTSALEWLQHTGPKLLLILVLTFAGLIVVRVISKRIAIAIRRTATSDELEAEKRAETLGSVIRYLLRVGVLVLGAVMLLGELGVKIGPLLAAAGVVGVAVGFGAQRLVADIISGFFILVEDQIRVGDVVEVAGKQGTVEKVSIRMTILRDWAGSVHYVRNSQIDIVTNLTKEYAFALFDVGVAYRENVDDVMGVIKEVADGMQADKALNQDILEPVDIMGVDRFADSAVVIRARIKTRPNRRWAIYREFNRRLKLRFDELGIEIPFPHMTLYAGQDKDGSAPPLHVSVERES